MTKNKKIETRRLTVSAVMIALAAALSMVRVYELPLGGSVTLLSMLPICTIAICYGTKWGLTCSFLYAFAQIALDMGKLMGYGMTASIWVGCLIFDYLIAFGGLGLSGLFSKKGTLGICIGIFLALLVRFISHFISGTILFGAFAPEGWNVYFYSLCYNGSYMLPELIFTMVGAALLFRLPQVKKLIDNRR